MRLLLAILICLLAISALSVDARADERSMKCYESINRLSGNYWIIKADKDVSRISFSRAEQSISVKLMWADEAWQHLVVYRSYPLGQLGRALNPVDVFVVNFARPSVVKHPLGNTGEWVSETDGAPVKVDNSPMRMDCERRD